MKATYTNINQSSMQQQILTMLTFVFVSSIYLSMFSSLMYICMYINTNVLNI